jgi:outer membrane protein assembly factor BamE (lipoprotein component of BamABCDE complex)
MRFISLFIAILSLSACMSMGKKVDQEKVSQFVKGKTTYAEVVQELGKPTQSTIHSDGTRTALYTYVQSQAKAASFIPIVGAFMGGADVESTTTTLSFDKKSVLTSYTATEGGSSTGTGLSSGSRQ